MIWLNANFKNTIPSNIFKFLFNTSLLRAINYFQKQSITSTCRNSRTEVSYKKSVLRNFANFTRKHLCQSLFFNKVPGLRHIFFCRTPPDDCFWTWFEPVFLNTMLGKYNISLITSVDLLFLSNSKVKNTTVMNNKTSVFKTQ